MLLRASMLSMGKVRIEFALRIRVLVWMNASAASNSGGSCVIDFTTYTETKQTASLSACDILGEAAKAAGKCGGYMWTYPITFPATTVGTCVLTVGAVQMVPNGGVVITGSSTVCKNYVCPTKEPTLAPTAMPVMDKKCIK